mgnify:FL=1
MRTAEETNIKVYRNITDHFGWAEIACSCCECIKVLPGTFAHMEKLELIRVRLGFPIHINSGYRCPSHNKAVGGSPRSWHMLFATDVRPSWAKEVPGGAADDDDFLRRLNAIGDEAEALGFGGIGKYGTFRHLDMRPEKSRWVL